MDKSWQIIEGGKILRFLLPGVHILYNPLHLSMNEACEYNKISHHDYVPLYGRRDFSDEIIFPNQLILNK